MSLLISQIRLLIRTAKTTDPTRMLAIPLPFLTRSGPGDPLISLLRGSANGFIKLVNATAGIFYCVMDYVMWFIVCMTST